MESFSSKVRFGGNNGTVIKGPLRRDFSESDWTNAWTHNRRDIIDDRLHFSGLWIYARWSNLHQYRDYLEGLLAPVAPKRQLIAWLNEQSRRQFEDLANRLAERAPGLEYFVTELGRSESGNPVASDAILVLCGDATKLILDTYGLVDEEEGYDSTNTIPALGKVFLGLTQLMQRWEECLQLDYWIEEDGDISIFRIPRSDFSISMAIAADRRQNNEAYLIRAFIDTWRHRRHILHPIVPIVVDARLRNGRLVCEISTRSPFMLDTSAARRAAEVGFPESLRALPLPEFDGLSVNELLDAYEVLASLGACPRNG